MEGSTWFRWWRGSFTPLLGVVGSRRGTELARHQAGTDGGSCGIDNGMEVLKAPAPGCLLVECQLSDHSAVAL